MDKIGSWARKGEVLQMKRVNKNRKILWAVVAVLIGTAVIVCIFLGNYLLKEKARQAEEAKKSMTYEEIASEVIKEKETDTEQSDYQSPVDFEQLWELNQDAYAWIQIPGTNIDYPILQKEDGDQSYYLNTTLTGAEGYPGSIYTENYNVKDFQDFNTVIYGHDLIDGTMFSELHKYADRNFMDTNPYVYIYTPDKMLKYQIFAAVVFDDRHLMVNFDFDNPSSYQLFLNEIYDLRDMQSVVKTDIPVTTESRIITMSTCIAERPDNRWLVGAVLVDEEN